MSNTTDIKDSRNNAESDDKDASYNLNICSVNDEETEDLKALFWIKKAAAENGSADAMNDLAICYENGDGVKKNLGKAFYWFQKAAENGNTDAMICLAT